MSLGLRRGIIEQAISKYEYKVRIINYDSDIYDPNKTLTSDLAVATVISPPGIQIVYSEGDRVIVGFNKDELDSPVILGSMYVEAFPTEDEQVTVPGIEDKLTALQDSISLLEGEGLYTHIKYSNDAGVTFTSLYEYTDVDIQFSDDNLVSYRGASNIEIDSNSSTIYWSVIDANNIDVTNTFTFTTTLKAMASDSSEVIDTATSSETVFEVPLRLKNYDKLLLDFKIVNRNDFDDYHFVLTTDKNVIGSTFGDYLGVCISTDIEAPDNPAQYAWTSFNNTIQNFIDNLNANLAPRVRRNEEALYGFNYDSSSQETDGTGLLDGITVTANRIDIHGTNNRNVSFNRNKSVYIDNTAERFIVPEVAYVLPKSSNEMQFTEVRRSNGHLTLTMQNI